MVLNHILSGVPLAEKYPLNLLWLGPTKGTTGNHRQKSATPCPGVAFSLGKEW
ncbi:hypothetical protein LBFF_1888 [Limosilactobacillus fermentum F-6]|uniref:Uncharacterized protein n=1 Tax=Limosilactobacillus fermentum TaxID=1613 RepID=A0A1D7ZWG3_LIMFE|nr:hypothetical protein LBFF_1888 [Limosilactobacillus fermentum F-6]AOR74210.1 Uncharacterized protein LACFE_CDS0745 [Limosilactobacillus fermentum]WCL67242.1 hypothetical protein MWLf4_2129 [Limosilactobacillus fermentum]